MRLHKPTSMSVVTSPYTALRQYTYRCQENGRGYASVLSQWIRSSDFRDSVDFCSFKIEVVIVKIANLRQFRLAQHRLVRGRRELLELL